MVMDHDGSFVNIKVGSSGFIYGCIGCMQLGCSVDFLFDVVHRNKYTIPTAKGLTTRI